MVGKDVKDAAKEASSVQNVKKVLSFENVALENASAEDMSSIVLQLAKSYSHVLAPATGFGKNHLPRAAALMNCAPLTDIIEVIDQETFKRPMYAGNAITTVKMGDAIKVGTGIEDTYCEKYILSACSLSATQLIHSCLYFGRFSSTSCTILLTATSFLVTAPTQFRTRS